MVLASWTKGDIYCPISQMSKLRIRHQHYLLKATQKVNPPRFSDSRASVLSQYGHSFQHLQNQINKGSHASFATYWLCDRGE